MVDINFQEWKAPMVESGQCGQTIRVSTQAKPGAVIRLITGEGTKHRRVLRRAVCKSVEGVTLMKTVVQPAGNTAITGIFLEDFAKADGFKTYADMWAFFEPRADENGEFKGYLIKW